MFREKLERWLLGRWYGPAPIAWLWPLQALFRLMVRLRRFAYDSGFLGTVAVDAPVLVVGNISVGGTGKTPLVLYLARQLTARGVKVGIVSRGYGGDGQPRLVSPDSDPAQVGDEPLLLARNSGVPVRVGPDRVEAARLLVQDGAQFILSDDGLQHYRLQRDFEIAVMDGERGLGNGACLPSGPLREPPGRLDTVDLVVINGSGLDQSIPGVTMQLQGHLARQVSGENTRPLESFRGQTVHALAGIGNPGRFFSALEKQGMTVLPRPKPDHAVFSAVDLAVDDGFPVLMTEKDAVKCEAFANDNTWYVPVEAVFSPEDEARLQKLLDDWVKTISGE